MSNCRLDITLSPDGFKAFGTFSPASGEGAKLDIEYVRSIIAKIGINVGIDWDLVNSTLDRCNETKKVISKVKIATGSLPISEVPEHWNLEEHFFDHAMGVGDLEANKVDYKERSSFIMVKKGELIATWDEGRNGTNGQTVKGKPIPFKKKKIVQFTNGDNTAPYKGNLYAGTSGKYEVTENRVIQINDVLHIQGNVDYSTGNISFGKDVIIEGQIKDGFKVAVGGSLYCKNNLDASDILCRKNLVIDQGLIGRGPALVRVGGLIQGKFIENCRVESKGGVEIEKHIVNSQILTLGSLKLGEKGSIVSSSITAQDCVETYNLGKSGSPNSTIEVGQSFIDKRYIDSIKQRQDVLKNKYKKLIRVPESRLTPKQKNLIAQIKDAINKGEAELGDKMKGLHNVDGASIKVKGTAFPGNTISINGVKYSITEEKHKVRFYLDSEKRRIEYSPL